MISGSISSKDPVLNVMTEVQYFVSISVENASTERVFISVGNVYIYIYTYVVGPKQQN